MESDFAIWGPIAREDLPGLCDRVCASLHDQLIQQFRGIGPGAKQRSVHIHRGRPVDLTRRGYLQARG